MVLSVRHQPFAVARECRLFGDPFGVVSRAVTSIGLCGRSAPAHIPACYQTERAW